MTSKAQITKIASRDGVDARVVERDFVLTHIVALVAAHDRDQRFVFKGGTSLRLLHFEEYRYSADLDYSIVRDGEAEARDFLSVLSERSEQSSSTSRMTSWLSIPSHASYSSDGRMLRMWRWLRTRVSK
jgi:predicted nucleotidyltransferase component of viral defense system